jgi:hypothetical protein
MARNTVIGTPESPVSRIKARASIGIDGLSGDGKSGLALLIALALSKYEPNKIYATDTENRALALYVGHKMDNGFVIPAGHFYHAPISKEEGYSAFNYEYHRKRAKILGCDVHIMDSFTHCWFRQGGVLDEVNKETMKNVKVNKFTAWGLPDIADAKNLIFELVRDEQVHVISTIRVKEFFAQAIDANGRTEIKSLGEKQMQTDGLTYEFDLVLSMITPGNAQGRPARVKVTKSRYDIFEKNVEYDMTPELIESLCKYLDEGVDVEVLNERIKTDLVNGLRERIINNVMLLTYFKNTYNDTKLADLPLDELRLLNSKCIELEYSN